MVEETAFLELIKENERQILHVCRYYSAIEWQKKCFWKKIIGRLSNPCLVGLLPPCCATFWQLIYVKTAYGSFWPPTSFWSFMGCYLFRFARRPDGPRKRRTGCQHSYQAFQPYYGLIPRRNDFHFSLRKQGQAVWSARLGSNKRLRLVSQAVRPAGRKRVLYLPVFVLLFAEILRRQE